MIRRRDASDPLATVFGICGAHIKAGLVGPSEAIPWIDGKLGLSTWQGIFFCEFDAPHRDRRSVVTLLADAWPRGPGEGSRASTRSEGAGDSPAKRRRLELAPSDGGAP